MSLIANGAGESAKSFYNGVIESSLRFNPSSSHYLNRTPGSTSNRKTFTLSAWVKRGNFPISANIMAAGTNGDGAMTILGRFDGNDAMVIYQDGDGSDGTTTPDYGGYTYDAYNNNEETYGVKFRDPSMWYNAVMSIDTVQSGATFDAAQSVNLYINGVEVLVDPTYLLW